LLKSKILKTPPSIIFKGENMKKCKFTLALDIDGDDIELNIAFESENYEDAIEFVKDVIKRMDVLKELDGE
jgi:hypothetical protein